MAFRDLLLASLTYPDATPDRALRSGVALAKRLGGDLAVATVREKIPELHNVLANALLDLDRLARREEARSAEIASHQAQTAALAAETADVAMHESPLVARLFEEVDAICAAARTRDACLISIGPMVLADTSLAEAVLFASGRPIVIYPEAVEITASSAFETIAVAWDGSAQAARAVADAMPLLKRAGSVRVLVVTKEKPQAVAGIAQDLIRHLAAHGVTAGVDEDDARGQSIGAVIADYTISQGIDLLVMGGFRHSRFREYMLGGATQSVLQAPPCPVLLSH